MGRQRMTIDEAIIHAEEKAKELREQAEQLRDIGERISNPKQPYNEPVKACRDCAEEHRQLAEWLKELKRMKRIISDTNQGSNQDDLISREALKKYKFTTQVCNGVEPEDIEVVPVAAIDNAPTITCKECDGYEAGYSAGEHDARPQGEWIPVSERLPDKRGEYTCTLRVYHYVFDGEREHDIVEARFFETYNGTNKWNIEYAGEKVIAWLPLPESYKEAEND